MSRTVKQEWSGPDSFHENNRIERKARPAGRMLAIVAAEMEAEGFEVEAA